MKNYYGKETSSLSDYRDTLPLGVDHKELDEKIHTVAYDEALQFLIRFENDKILTIDDICLIFDFKYDFVRNNLMKNPYFSILTINPIVKQLLIQIGKLEIGAVGENMVLKSKHKSICNTITTKKTYILKSDLMKFIQTNFFLVINGEKLPLTSDGCKGVLSEKWKSPKTLKEELGMKYDMQIHRELSKEGHYMKLVYIPPQSKGKHVTRYLKM